MVEQGFLAGVEGVEAHEDEFIVLWQDLSRRGQRVGHAAIDHSGVGQSLCRQRGPEAFIERIQDVPDFRELMPAGTFPVMPGLTGHLPRKEAVAECRDRRFLVVREEIIVDAQRLEVAQVDQQAAHVDPVFVEVVEVAQQDVTPVKELIKTLRLFVRRPRHQRDIFPVEDVEQPDFFRRLAHPRDAGEEFVDRHHVGHEHRLPGGDAQIAFEERRGATVGKHEADAVQRSAPHKSIGDCFEKLHYVCFLFPGYLSLETFRSARPLPSKLGPLPLTMPRVAWFPETNTPGNKINNPVFPGV